MIRLVYGLGNPGPDYQKTRHNIGQMVVERLREQLGLQYQVKGKIAYVQNAQRLIFAKSTDFMNLSGQSLQPFLAFFKIKAEEVLVLHDEMEVEMAEIQHKKGGGSAGHNGLKNLTQVLGSNNYERLRLGIGRPQHGAPADFVLKPFGKSELELVELLIARALDWLATSSVFQT